MTSTTVESTESPSQTDPVAPKVLVLGLGNDVLSDDAIGLFVARELRRRFAGHPSVHARETAEMGLALLDFLVGYDAAAIVDSIQTGRAEPGFIHKLDAASLTQFTGRTPHFLGVGETLALGARLQMPMPKQVMILAVEVEDPFTLSTQLTPALQAALPAIVEQIVSIVSAMAGIKASNGRPDST